MEGIISRVAAAPLLFSPTSSLSYLYQLVRCSAVGQFCQTFLEYAATNVRQVTSLVVPLLAIVPLATNNTYTVKEPPLTTDWTYRVGTNPWPEYPRPQLQRAEWRNLNGVWKYQNSSSLDAVHSPPFGHILQHEVLVPSCLESGLSGKFILMESEALLTRTNRNTGY